MRFQRWLEDNWPWLLWFAVVTGVNAGLLAAYLNFVAHQRAEKAHFMAECQKERREYECLAMWRESQW